MDAAKKIKQSLEELKAIELEKIEKSKKKLKELEKKVQEEKKKNYYMNLKIQMILTQKKLLILFIS